MRSGPPQEQDWGPTGAGEEGAGPGAQLSPDHAGPGRVPGLGRKRSAGCTWLGGRRQGAGWAVTTREPGGLPWRQVKASASRGAERGRGWAWRRGAAGRGLAAAGRGRAAA